MSCQQTLRRMLSLPGHKPVLDLATGKKIPANILLRSLEHMQFTYNMTARRVTWIKPVDSTSNWEDCWRTTKAATLPVSHAYGRPARSVTIRTDGDSKNGSVLQTAPYIVTLTELSDRAIRWLNEDPERLKQLSPGKFQALVADRLEHMGLEVQMVGDVFRKDGGVDIVAYPKRTKCSFPFLIGVQVEHHRLAGKTGSPKVRDFHGVLTSKASPFHVGMLVTNTSFTPDAKWFADQNSSIMRLRDLSDLRRWLLNDYVNESEWREIPDEIELAPGVLVVIPKGWLQEDLT